MYGMYFLLVVFLYCNLLQPTLVGGLLLPFLYIHTSVVFNKCIQTVKHTYRIRLMETLFTTTTMFIVTI